MRISPARRVLCLILICCLFPAGLLEQRHWEKPVFGLDLPCTGVSAFLTASASRQEPCLTEQHELELAPVRLKQRASRLDKFDPRRDWGTVLVIPAFLRLLQRAARPRYWNAFPAPGRRAILRHIHRTRRKKP